MFNCAMLFIALLKTGCYSDSVGMELVRQHTAKYIEQRDGGRFPSDPNDIVLCSGATEGIRVAYN